MPATDNLSHKQKIIPVIFNFSGFHQSKYSTDSFQDMY